MEISIKHTNKGLRMVTKVKGHPYFFVIITSLLKDNSKCLANNQPKTFGTIVTLLFVCFLVLHPYFLSFQCL